MSCQTQALAINPKNASYEAKQQLLDIKENLKTWTDIQNRLEVELRTIASKRLEIYPILKLPETFGTLDHPGERRLEGMLTFNPANPLPKFSTTWNLIMTYGAPLC